MRLVAHFRPGIVPFGVALALTLALAAGAAAQTNTPVPPAFFAVSPTSPSNFPPVPLGTIGHPNFAWATTEAIKDSFDFSAYESCIDDAQGRGLIDPATNTINMAITLGLTPRWGVAARDTGTCTRSAPGGTTQCSAPRTAWRTGRAS